MTVNPPPATAPATTACFKPSVKLGARVARYVMEALSLKAARPVGVRLRFVQKPNKDSTPLREGAVDLETGVVEKRLGSAAPLFLLCRFVDRNLDFN